MFHAQQLKALGLPEKTLCLTFDDGPGETEGNGPGPKTLELAQYLAEENVFATFFVVGKFVEKYPKILPKVAEFGHLVGNHTYHHIDIRKNDINTIVSEIIKTDEIINKFISHKSVFFRAPWGGWEPEIAPELNQRVNNDLNHIGPIFWDITGSDWAYWRDNGSAEECANQYIQQIRTVNRGIVLMHDSSADADPFGEQLRNGNRTLGTIQILVPQLKSMGYSFVRLDDIQNLLS
jgi:peptidoglycan/xylan/chitin deacetylase (PgdA/CDA1 family)